MMILASLLTTSVASAKSGNYKPPFKKIRNSATVLSITDLKKNLEFDFDRSMVRNRYDDKLDQLAKLLLNNNSAVALRGYADSIGSFKGNWKLSEKRADMVKNYLIKQGVPAGKIVTTAFGSTNPVASNKTLAGRQKNRRVEIKIGGAS